MCIRATERRSNALMADLPTGGVGGCRGAVAREFAALSRRSEKRPPRQSGRPLRPSTDAGRQTGSKIMNSGSWLVSSAR